MVPATAPPNVKVSVPPSIVGWCNECEVYVEPYTSGESCPGDHEIIPEGSRTTWRPFDFVKRLRKRRMYICRVDYCDRPGFFDLEEWRAHFMEHVEAELECAEGAG